MTDDDHGGGATKLGAEIGAALGIAGRVAAPTCCDLHMAEYMWGIMNTFVAALTEDLPPVVRQYIGGLVKTKTNDDNGAPPSGVVN